MADDQYLFKNLDTKAKMKVTSTGHIGFNIVDEDDVQLEELLNCEWRSFVESGDEVLLIQSQDRVGSGASNKNRGSFQVDNPDREHDNLDSYEVHVCDTVLKGTHSSPSHLSNEIDDQHHGGQDDLCEESEKILSMSDADKSVLQWKDWEWSV